MFLSHLQRVLFALMCAGCISYISAATVIAQETSYDTARRALHNIQPTLPEKAASKFTLEAQETAAFETLFSLPQPHYTITESKEAFLQKITQLLEERSQESVLLTFKKEDGTTRTLHLNFSFSRDFVGSVLTDTFILTVTSTSDLTDAETKFLSAVVQTDGFLTLHLGKVLAVAGVVGTGIMMHNAWRNHQQEKPFKPLKEFLKTYNVNLVFLNKHALRSKKEEIVPAQLGRMGAQQLNICQNGLECWITVKPSQNTTQELIALPLSSFLWLLGGTTKIQRIANLIDLDAGIAIGLNKNIPRAIRLILSNHPNLFDLIVDALNIPARPAGIRTSVILLVDDLPEHPTTTDFFPNIPFALRDPEFYTPLLTCKRFDGFISSMHKSSTQFNEAGNNTPFNTLPILELNRHITAFLQTQEPKHRRN